MPRIWVKTASFDSIAPGDQLAILVKSETADTIKRFSALLSSAGDPAQADEPQQELAQGSETASVSALAAYVAELLEKGFPVSNIMARGSRLHLEIVRPVKPGDTLVLSGRVTSKREEQDRGVVECEVTIENQEGEIVTLAEATVSF